jgi:hypothetical protein
LPEVVRLSLSAVLGAPEADFRETAQKPASSGTLQALLSLSTHATEAIDRDYAYLSSDVRQKLKGTIRSSLEAAFRLGVQTAGEQK